ncbi:hypothetical protein B0H66DRAFT_601482 [Apodospora peruviana]|uniref:Uncharacterized protein n=1 Tax=Apodospora peruviana TaxID=516989 RepID=A0AAE0IBQ4_9PEZI|nr:hypothetical protein B0H66DRAFT_601482 [Apodospora peruviana]
MPGPWGTSSRHEDPGFVKAEAPFDTNYEPEVLDGMPCAIQIVTSRFQDDEFLNSLRFIELDLSA